MNPNEIVTTKKETVMEIMREYVTDMEGYCYYGSNFGIPEDNIEEIASRIENVYKG